MTQLKRFAVMGNPVAHSLSPMIHQMFAKQMHKELVYEKLAIDLLHFEEQVTTFFREGGNGLNITAPFKEQAFAMSQKRSPRCLKAQAANTLWMEKGKLCADNTDGVGFVRDVEKYVTLADKKILLLGAGGAARGILEPLLLMKPSRLTIANRNLDKAKQLCADYKSVDYCTYDALTEAKEIDASVLAASQKIAFYDLIINATSASLVHDIPLLPTSILEAKPFCYDLAYRHKEATPFVVWAREQRCDAVDGLGMLVEQAAESFFIWHGVKPNPAFILQHLL